MARDGNGSYSLPQPAFVSGTTISSAAVNSDLSDIANALTQSVSRDGQTPITGNQPMSGYRHTGVGNAASRTDYAAAGQVQDGALIWGGTAGGTTTALTISTTPATTAYAAGQTFSFLMGASPNGGATTLNVNSLGAKSVVKPGGAALGASELPANTLVHVIYDGTNFILIAPVAVTGSLGEIKPLAHSTVPGGFLLCYGQPVSRTTYAALFAVLGTAWGAGDGATTFNVPDLRGRALFGKDDMGGSSASRVTAGVSGVDGLTVGATGGDQRTQQHNHTLTDPGHTHSFSGGSVVGGAGGGVSGGAGATLTSGVVSANTTGITLATYGAGSSQNMPPAAVVNWIIYAGV